MANIYTSALITYVDVDPLEVSETEFDITSVGISLGITIEHYTSGDVLIGEIGVQEFAIENHDGVNTRMRVTPKAGQIANGEKIKIIVDDGV